MADEDSSDRDSPESLKKKISKRSLRRLQVSQYKNICFKINILNEICGKPGG